ncbi:MULTISPECIES: NmrA family NAD(P)-binding protein [Comamonadaceae]|uniref:NmrA family NAD(P)-binding protein n=1 Tax=Acidovorax sacchari TaxID=3230736 RepID=UPI0034A37729
MNASHSPRPVVLVYLAAGVQGSAVVRAALARGFRVRAMVRDPARVPEHPSAGVEWVRADLDDLASLREACIGVRHAVVRIPTGPAGTMASQAGRAAIALAAAGLRSVVLALASASRPAPCAEPGFVGNALVEEALRRAGLAFATVRPTMYLDNLLKPSARQEIAGAGIFAPPIASSQRIAWTSVDDCARAAIALLERGGTGDHRIAGPQSLGGDGLAACIAAGLGRPVAYRAQSIDAFEREVDAAMGPGMGRRIASKFRYFEAHPEEADAILARPFTPGRGLEDFVPTDALTWVRLHRGDFLGGGTGGSPDPIMAP